MKRSIYEVLLDQPISEPQAVDLLAGAFGVAEGDVLPLESPLEAPVHFEIHRCGGRYPTKLCAYVQTELSGPVDDMALARWLASATSANGLVSPSKDHRWAGAPLAWFEVRPDGTVGVTHADPDA